MPLLQLLHNVLTKQSSLFHRQNGMAQGYGSEEEEGHGQYFPGGDPDNEDDISCSDEEQVRAMGANATRRAFGCRSERNEHMTYQ